MFKHTSFPTSQPLRLWEYNEQNLVYPSPQYHTGSNQTGQSLCHGLCQIGMRVLRVVDLKFIICIFDFGLQRFFKDCECRNETVTYQGHEFIGLFFIVYVNREIPLFQH